MVKKTFSTSWKSSKQPRKQRKYLFNAPLHIKRKMMTAPLDKELRKKHNRKNIEVRKGDEVKIMRGKFKGKQGKISSVNIKKMKIAIEGIQNIKKDGTKINAWLNPSKVKIISLELDDQKRMKNKLPIKETRPKPEKTKIKGENKNASEKKRNA